MASGLRQRITADIHDSDVLQPDSSFENDRFDSEFNDEVLGNSTLEDCDQDEHMDRSEEDFFQITPIRICRISVLGKKKWRAKKQEIMDVLRSDPLDLILLQELAIKEGGLLEDSLRRKVWPKLLELDPYEVSPKPSLSDVINHEEYTQVLMDVQRCLRRFPPGIPLERRVALQDELTSLIVRVLIKHPQLHYYQGYHDICVTVLLVLGEELGFALMEKLSTSGLSMFMEPTMESTVEIMNYIFPIVGKLSPKLRDHLEKSEVGSLFCLSWLITWFGHVLNDYNQIVRLYDFFLATHSLMPIYLAAAVVLHQQDHVLALEQEMAIIHQFLSNVPDDLPFEQLLSRAVLIFDDYPPEEVAKDAAKDLKTEKGFYHKWFSSKSSSTFGTALSNRMRNALVNLNPFNEGGRFSWVAAVTVFVPIAVAVYLCSISFDKFSKRVFSNS